MTHFLKLDTFGFAMLVALGMLGSGTAGAASPGVTDSEIVLGETTVMTGPRAERPLQQQRGAQVYFDQVNAKGGVNGRKIRVVSKDDAYNPVKAVENVRALLKDDHAFAIFQPYGTNNTKAIISIAEADAVPLLAPIASGTYVRDTGYKHVFPVRASYEHGVERVVDYLIGKRGIKEIGLMAQDDSWGFAGRGLLQKALGSRQLQITGRGSIGADMSVRKGVEALKAAGAKAVLIWSQGAPAANIIKSALEIDYHPVFIGTSGIISSELYAEIGKLPAEVLLITPFSEPSNSKLPIAREAVAELKRAGVAEPNSAHFEGYVDAAVVVEGLKRAGKELTRESFERGLDQMHDFDLGGLTVHYKPGHHEGMTDTLLEKLDHGKLVPLTGGGD